MTRADCVFSLVFWGMAVFVAVVALWYFGGCLVADARLRRRQRTATVQDPMGVRLAVKRGEIRK